MSYGDKDVCARGVALWVQGPKAVLVQCPVSALVYVIPQSFLACCQHIVQDFVVLIPYTRYTKFCFA